MFLIPFLFPDVAVNIERIGGGCFVQLMLRSSDTKSAVGEVEACLITWHVVSDAFSGMGFAVQVEPGDLDGTEPSCYVCIARGFSFWKRISQSGPSLRARGLCGQVKKRSAICFRLFVNAFCVVCVKLRSGEFLPQR